MEQLEELPIYTGVYPSSNIDNDNDYANAVFDYIGFHGNTLIPFINTNYIPNMNTIIGEINTISQQVSNDKEAVIEAKEAAVQSATDAQSAKDAAEQLWDKFDDRYLGAFDVAPTFDNDGDALQDGALYVDKSVSPKVLKFYDAELEQWISSGFTPTAHGGLSGLSDANAHPIASITGLEKELDNLSDSNLNLNTFMKKFTSETPQDVTFNLIDNEGDVTSQTIPNLAKTKLDIKKNIVDMDDYEEGTFHPSFTSGININIIEAKYTKTGKFVTIYIHGSVLNVGTDDALYLEGLPFVSNNYSSSVVDFGFIKSNFAYSRVLKDLNKMDFLTPNADGSYRSVIKGSDVGASYFIINASYKVK